MKIVLHNYWRSSASHRVRIGLGLKGLAFEYVPVNIVTGEQFDSGYRARNPIAQVPTLEITEDDGTERRITQSIAILEYLDDRWIEPAILPRDPYLRARARALAPRWSGPLRPVVVTLHRPSNVDDPIRLAALASALSALAVDRPVVFPVHPRTRERLQRSGAGLRPPAAPRL